MALTPDDLKEQKKRINELREELNRLNEMLRQRKIEFGLNPDKPVELPKEMVNLNNYNLPKNLSIDQIKANLIRDAQVAGRNRMESVKPAENKKAKKPRANCIII